MIYQGTPKYWLPRNPKILVTKEPHRAARISWRPHTPRPPLQSRAGSLGCTGALQQNIGIKIYFGLAGRSFKLAFEHMR